ncbi:MAG: DUF3788 domain-containing protein [Asgard group archaeon]|nr:DUF3788 domain-containing protein [Asgard group archaeon]
MDDEAEAQRLIQDNEPTNKDIITIIGSAKDAWLAFTTFLDETYDFSAEKINYGKKYGWAIRYRKSNKTWCALYPEKDRFQVQIIFGKKEVELFAEKRSEFGDFVLNKFDNTKQLHDGRWMFFTIEDNTLLEDLKKLMLIKRKPKKK